MPRLLASAILAGLVLLPAVSFSQAARRLAWDQPDATAAEASAFRFRVFVDGVEQPDLVQATCTAGTVTVCSIPLPSSQPGNRTVQLQAVEPAHGLESAKSDPFLYRFPARPVNTRVQ